MRGSTLPETPRQRNTKERLERGVIILDLGNVVSTPFHRKAVERILQWELLDMEIADYDVKIEEARRQLAEQEDDNA